MDLRWTLTMFSVLCGSLLRGSAAATGLQLYYYRQPIGTNTNPIQSWKVEGLATRIAQGVFSDNLDCNTTSNNGAGISWTGQVPFNPSWVQSLLNGKRLALDSFNNINFGIYTCYDSATNESLNVNITSANPVIQAVSDVVTIEAGSSGQLKVYVSGIPDPTSTDIAWFKVGPGGNTTELKELTVNFSSDHRTLLLTNVQDSDGGTYKCIVTQRFYPYPSANVIIQLTITRKNGFAVITQQPSNLSLVQSSNATLSCSATGSPAPNITWWRTGGSGLPYSATIVTYGSLTTTTSTLSIVNTQPQDGGQYQCQAIVPGTTPVWSQPAFIQVLQQTTPQSTDTGTAPGSITSTSVSTCDPTQGCTSSLHTSTPLPIIIVGTAAGGGAVLIIIGAVLLVYVCVYFRYCKPHKGVATWPENGTRTKSSTNVLFDRTGNGDQSHILFKQTPSTADGEVLYDRYLTDVPTPSHSNAILKDPIYSPLSASEVSKTCHEYTGIVGSSVPADYNRLQRDSLKRNPSSNTTGENAAHPQATQIPGEITSGEVQQYALSEHNNRNTSDGNGGGDGSAGDGSVTTGNSNSQSAVFQSPPPVQLLSQTAGKIPIRRHGLNTLAVVPEGPASLYSSAISALSSVPASSLSITSPSNVFVGPTVVERAPVTPRVGEKSGSSVLSSVPEHAVSVHRPYENVVIPASAVTRYQVPTPTPNGTEARQVPSPTPNGTKDTAGPPPGYEDVTTEQPWYELAEETDSDVNVPVAASTVQRVQTLPHHTSRSGQHHGAHAHNSAAQNVGPHRPIAYRGSLSRAPPPRTEAKREVYFSASSLSCGTTV